MLITRIVLTIGQLTAASLPLIDVGSGPSQPTMTPMTPGEPSTLLEALIGAGLIASYLLLARQMRGRRSVRPISRPTSAGSGRKAA